MKAAAEKGAAKAELEMMAKQLVQIRNQKKKLYAGTSSMQGIDSQMASAQMSKKMAQSMHGASKVYIYSQSLKNSKTNIRLRYTAFY